jgi:hypothetical protein
MPWTTLLLKPPTELTAAMLPYWRSVVQGIEEDKDFSSAYPILKPIYDQVFNQFEDGKLL